MPSWQSELEALLAQFHVSLDTGHASTQPARSSSAPDGPLGANDVDDTMDASIPWELGALTAEETPADGDEVYAVRSEIEATVRRVIDMARAGHMESALRDDVVFVLQALTRPNPGDTTGKRRQSRLDESTQDWQLTSAAAVLRFCRVVLRLTDELSREAES